MSPSVTRKGDGGTEHSGHLCRSPSHLSTKDHTVFHSVTGGEGYALDNSLGLFAYQYLYKVHGL